MTVPRIRTKGSITALTGASRSCLYSTPLPSTTCNAWTQTGTGDLVGNGETQETHDEVHPMFKKLSREGGIFNGPFYTVKVTKAWTLGNLCTSTFKVPPGYPVVGTVQRSEWTGKLASYMNASRCAALTPSFNVETARTLAGTAALANVEAPEVQGLVDLAEMRKTMQMLRAPIVDLAGFLLNKKRKLRKQLGRGPTPKEWWDYASGKWLEWRYGWTPLLASIRGLQSALAKERKSMRKTARGNSFRTPQKATDVRTSTVPAGTSGWNYNSSLKLEVTGTVKAGVLYTSNFSLDNDLGISLRELPMTALELVPYSFVADWAFNFGDFLRASVPHAGVDTLAMWTTDETIMTYTGSNVVTPVNGYAADPYLYSGGGTTLAGTTVVRYKSRTPSIDIGLASKLQEIQFVKPKDWYHLADAIALLSGAISGKTLSTVRK